MEFQGLARCEKRPAKWRDSAPLEAPIFCVFSPTLLPRFPRWKRSRRVQRVASRVGKIASQIVAVAARALAPRSGERAQDSTNNLVRVRGATSCPSPQPSPRSAGRGSIPRSPLASRGSRARGYVRFTSPGNTSNTSALPSISAKTAASAPVIQACAPSASSSA